MKIDPSAPAFPAGNLRMQIGDDGTVSPVPGGPNGLTIRAHIAAMAMQSLFGPAATCKSGGVQFADVAEDAVKMADALIMKLNK